jgi:hypothetical protein
MTAHAQSQSPEPARSTKLDAEMLALRAWLDSEEGRAAVQAVREKSDREAAEFNAALRLPREVLYAPFTR